MTIIVETDRLRLRECTIGDLEEIATMVADEEQMRFYPGTKTRDEASAWIDHNMNLYKRLGFGFWLMESIANAEFVGYCGIRPHEWLSEIEMGWHIKKPLWGQGLATEAAVASRDLGFDRFRLDRLIAMIDPSNVASIHVAEKIGMHLANPLVHDEWGSVLYAIEHQ
jgi:RimJ/RimL family protein N-acetyltransferase